MVRGTVLVFVLCGALAGCAGSGGPPPLPEVIVAPTAVADCPRPALPARPVLSSPELPPRTPSPVLLQHAALDFLRLQSYILQLESLLQPEAARD